MKAVLFLLTTNPQWLTNKNRIIVLGAKDSDVQDYLMQNSDIEVVPAEPALSAEDSLISDFSGGTGWPDFLVLEPTSYVVIFDDVASTI